jgi:polygalacturonase
MHRNTLSRRSVLYAGFAVPLFAGSAQAASGLKFHQISATAPFDMPSITVPDFSNSRRFVITDFGASQADQQKTSQAIAAAIAAANRAGSGVVVIPEGVWPTGPIHLKSHVNLYLSKGSVLLFSEKPEDYLPAVQTSWEGIECFNYSPLIYAFDCENIALSGEGKLKAKLDIWRAWYARPKPHMEALVSLYMMAYRGVPVTERNMAIGENHLRPHFVQFNRCRNVLIEDVTLEDSPFWCLHPLLCRDVLIRRVKIRAHGHNNDGVDPEMSQNVLIEDCVFDQGDDAISVKSGRDMDAWRLNTPSKNIIMRNCKIKNGHQLMALRTSWSTIATLSAPARARTAGPYRSTTFCM